MAYPVPTAATSLDKGDVIDYDGCRSTLLTKPKPQGGGRHGPRVVEVYTTQGTWLIPADAMVRRVEGLGSVAW